MADQPALNATFFAFRKRERAGVLTTITIAYIVIAVAIFGIFGWLNYGAVADYFTWATEMGANPEQAMTPPASVMALGPMMFLLQIFYYIIAAAYEASCLRWMIRGETGGILGFSFGADTWRVYFTYWIWFFLAIGLGIGMFVVFGSVIGSMFAFGAAGGDTSNAGGIAIALPFLFLGLLCALIYVSVRLAPAAATSVARNRFAFFDAWKVTRGRFWALFGAFVLLFLMYCVAYVVLSAAAGVAMAVGMAGSIGTMGENPTPEQMMQMFSQPAVLAPLVVIYGLMIIGAFVFMVALFGINARAAVAALEEGKITAEA